MGRKLQKVRLMDWRIPNIMQLIKFVRMRVRIEASVNV